ncbi:Homeobox Even-Skipped Protein 2 [Manis pentadactyla]|nr:Homeobox Even-Skipped Protein 2 [Manis pentadactyla]
MHMIRLRREFGFNSDLSARGECEIQFQDYSEAIVVSMVILEFQATGPRLASCFRYGMTDIEADGVGSETLALRKELGSWSDVTGSARCWNRVMVKCEILTKGLGAGVSSLWKDLGSGSDMTGSARWWIRVMLKCRILTPGLGLELVETLALRKELGFFGLM